MKLNKFISAISIAFFLSAPAFGQLVGTDRLQKNIWLPSDKQIQFGNYPNASINYTGGNLVIDILNGGGKVSFPDGVDLGAGNQSLGASLIFEGATANAFETTVTVVDPTADRTVTIPDATGATILSAGGVADSASAISGGTGSFIFEGATADGSETTISVVDPNADRAITFPNATGVTVLSTGVSDAANAFWGDSNVINFEGATADAFETTVTLTDPTADRTLTLPNATGTVCVAGQTSVVSGANAACTATCGSLKCLGGFDAGVPTITDCSDATSDKCYCVPN